MSDSFPPLPPPASAPAAPPPAPGPPAPRPVRGWATAVCALLVTCAALAGVGIVLEVYGLYALDRYMLGWTGIEALEAYDAVSVAVSVPWAAVTLAAGACWLVWQYRVASTVILYAPLRRSPGWHVASWVIPVIAWWFPVQNIRDLVQTTRAQVRSAVLGWWWALWVLSTVTAFVADRVRFQADTAETLNAGMSMSLVTQVVTIGAAAFAMQIVARITDAVDPRPR